MIESSKISERTGVVCPGATRNAVKLRCTFPRGAVGTYLPSASHVGRLFLSIMSTPGSSRWLMALRSRLSAYSRSFPSSLCRKCNEDDDPVDAFVLQTDSRKPNMMLSTA